MTTRALLDRTPTHLWRRRLPQLFVGFLVIGFGAGMLIESHLGASPWDVLHQGVAIHTPLSIGSASIVLGLVVFLAWFPLHQRPGIGTVLNVLLIGPSIDLALWILPTPDLVPVRVLYLVLGVVLFGAGGGMYIGAGLGPGPRDGVMTGIAARGRSIRLVRTALEVGAVAVGWALGGTVGVGTVLVALLVGPVVQVSLRWSDVDGTQRVRQIRQLGPSAVR